MIQNIEPHIYKNVYSTKKIADKSRVMIFIDGNIYGNFKSAELSFPEYRELGVLDVCSKCEFTYLISIDNEDYFLMEIKNLLGDIANIKNDLLKLTGYTFESIWKMREMSPKPVVFAGMTALHLSTWYSNNKFCGRCGSEMIHGTREREVHCEKCGNIVYPKISPGIIIRITDGDRILLTKYAGRVYKKFALVAGFNEIGETLEDTINREVMEEVGLKVKNIKYIASQPWGYSESLLCGFSAELDGDDKITLEEDELAVGEWYTREQVRDELKIVDEDFSLTNKMIVDFVYNG